MALEFKTVAAQVLAMYEVLFPQWMGGRRVGNEWVAAGSDAGGPGKSWKINLTTGAWIHGASGRGGLDAISMYAAMHNIENLAALHKIGPQVGQTEVPVRVLPPRAEEVEDEPALEVPIDAPPVPPHPQLGPHSAVWHYPWTQAVCRYDLEGGGKTIRPLTWRRNKDTGVERWVWRGHPGPIPLYGVELLRADPYARVLVVEGEKCAEAARLVLRGFIVVTWAGGAPAPAKTDWGPMRGRDIVLWPDADKPGIEASARVAELIAKVEPQRVRTLDTTGQPEGWDIADAIEDGWDNARILAWMKDRLRHTLPPTNGAAGKQHPVETPPPVDSAVPATVEDHRIEAGESSVVRWEDMGLDSNQGGMPHPTIANVSRIIQLHPRLRNHIWYDQFRDKIFHDLNGIEERWTDDDDRELTVTIQQALHLHKFNLKLVAEGVMHAAYRNKRNSLVDWLKGLEWDGTERLDTWLSDCLGVERSAYTDAVSRNWAIGMIARAFIPGCKMDNMPVLEGPTGLFKTTFLENLGGPWYKALPSDFGSKGFLESIVGSWLVEIPDMTGFKYSDHSKVIAIMTIRNDEYRRAYGRNSESYPRSCVFAATSEKDEYLADMRGHRRYWPLRCMFIDLDALASQRDQVFAEAIKKFREGAKWWMVPTEAADEQRQRAIADPWEGKVLAFADQLWEQGKTLPFPRKVTSEILLDDAVQRPTKDQTQIDKNRIARIMQSNNWIQKSNGRERFWKKVER